MKITTSQRLEIVSMIKAELITLSVANDMCQLLGFGRCIQLSDIVVLELLTG